MSGHASRSIELASIRVSLSQRAAALFSSKLIQCELPVSAGKSWPIALATKSGTAWEQIMRHRWKCSLDWFRDKVYWEWRQKVSHVPSCFASRHPWRLLFSLRGEETRRRHCSRAFSIPWTLLGPLFLLQATHMGWQIISAEHPLKMSGLLSWPLLTDLLQRKSLRKSLHWPRQFLLWNQNFEQSRPAGALVCCFMMFHALQMTWFKWLKPSSKEHRQNRCWSLWTRTHRCRGGQVHFKNARSQRRTSTGKVHTIRVKDAFVTGSQSVF